MRIKSEVENHITKVTSLIILRAKTFTPSNFVNINNKQRPPHEYQFLPLSRGSQRGSEQAEFEAVQTTPNPS